MASLAEVVIANGALRVHVPSAWKLEVEPDGGFAFRAGGASGGVLRVRLMHFTSEDVLSQQVAMAQLEAMDAEPDQVVEALPNGYALRTHTEVATSNGEATTFHVWLLAGIDPPHRMRLAVFSYAVPSRHLGHAETRSAITLIGKEVKRARFGKPAA